MTCTSTDDIWLSYQSPKTLFELYQKTGSEKVGAYALEHFTRDSVALSNGHKNSHRRLHVLLTTITNKRPKEWDKWAAWIDTSYSKIFNLLIDRHTVYGRLSHWLGGIQLDTLQSNLHKIQTSKKLPHLVTSYLLVLKVKEDLEAVLSGLERTARSMTMYEGTLCTLHDSVRKTFYAPICTMREILRPKPL